MQTWMPRTLYTWTLYLLCPLVLLRLLIKGARNPAYLRRWGERFGFGATPVSGAIWIHAVSVGEARAAGPFLEAFIKLGHKKFIITTMTPTGGDVVMQMRARYENSSVVIQHRYVPYDLPAALRRFMRRARPLLLMILETEIWPNLLHVAKAHDIPVVYTNVRLSQRASRNYMCIVSLLRPALRCVRVFTVQSEVEATRLVALGAEVARVHVCGNVKYELQMPAQVQKDARDLISTWGETRPVWIAASTHHAEEAMALTVHAQLKTHHPQLLLILVPRHPERFDAVARLCRHRNMHTARHSDSYGHDHGGERGNNATNDDVFVSRASATLATIDVYLGDTMGELPLLYAAADVAFVGGSLVPHGGHNLLEPCALGRAVLFGPHIFNFHEIAEQVTAGGAGYQVANTEELASAINNLLQDAEARARMGAAGQQLIKKNSGALEKSMAAIASHIPCPRYID